jgi:hypothetical protein
MGNILARNPREYVGKSSTPTSLLAGDDTL